MIKWKQAGMGLQEFGLDFNNPDFVKYAEAYGAHGHRLEKTEDLGALINSCFDKGGVHLLDVPVDYSENEKVLTEHLAKRIASL